MMKQLLRAALVGLAALTGIGAAAQTVTMTTDAPAGTRLRIYPSFVDDVTVEGADWTGEYGIYLSKAASSTITVKGKLTQLEVYGNQLTSIKIEDEKDLFILKCYNNKLSTLDLSTCPELVNLDAHGNNLETINLASNTKLERVQLSENKLHTVVAGAQPVLEELDLSHNQLSEIELDGCAGLKTLKLNNNRFEFVDLSVNDKIDWLQIFGNKIAGADMEAFCETIAKPTGSTFYALYIVNTLDPTEGNRCSAANVALLHDRKDWAVLDWYDGQVGNGMIGKVYDGYDVVPSVNEKHQISLKTTRKVGDKISLQLKSSGDIRVEGLNEPVKVGTDKAIEYTIASQTVTIVGDVTELGCDGNDLTAINFFGTPVLTKLSCADNKIEHLSVVNCATLTTLNAKKNSLKTATVQGCTSLGQINIYDNSLAGAAMANFMRSLPSTKSGILRIIDTESVIEHNVATTTDVAIAKEKGWGVWDYFGGGNYGMGKKYEGSEPGGDEVTPYFAGTTVTATQVQIEFAGANVSESQMPVVEGAEIQQWTGRALQLGVTPGKEFRVYGDFTEIQGALCDLATADITRLPNLTYFMMVASELSSLDLSQSVNLNIINVYGNRLSTLDFSTCPHLRQVQCYGNNITGANMTAMINSLVSLSEADYGRIIIYDSSYEREHNLCLSSDVNIALDKYWAVYELKNRELVQYFGETSGIEGLDVENEAPVYYNLQGVRVDNPAKGIYIERRGKRTSKVMLH